VDHVSRSLVDAPDAARSAGRHIAGVVRLPDGLALIQNLDAFLDAAESVRLDQAMSAQGDGVTA
jgi:hypothetical protein